MTRLIWSNDEPTGLQPTTDNSPSEGQNRPDLPGLVRRAVRAGEDAPRFRLPDQRGRVVMLSALLAKGPVVLRFCRHGGTSSCFRELDALVAVHVEIERRGATLAVITAPPMHPHPADKDPAAYAFPVLTDKGAKVARSYGLACRSPPIGRSPATAADRNETSKQRDRTGSAPATYVVDQECVVALAFVDLEGSSRMAPDQIVVALECLSKRKRGCEDRPLTGRGANLRARTGSVRGHAAIDV
jgi:peroxiredoxin